MRYIMAFLNTLAFLGMVFLVASTIGIREQKSAAFSGGCQEVEDQTGKYWRCSDEAMKIITQPCRL